MRHNFGSNLSNLERSPAELQDPDWNFCSPVLVVVTSVNVQQGRPEVVQMAGQSSGQTLRKRPVGMVSNRQ